VDGLFVVEGIETVPQGLAVDRHAGHVLLLPRLFIVRARLIQASSVQAKNPLHLGRIKAVQNGADGIVGWRRFPRRAKQFVKPLAVRFDEAVHLAIGIGTRQNRQNGRQKQGSKLPFLALSAARIIDS